MTLTSPLVGFLERRVFKHRDYTHNPGPEYERLV
jgi:hypothetical protein